MDFYRFSSFKKNLTAKTAESVSNGFISLENNEVVPPFEMLSNENLQMNLYPYALLKIQLYFGGNFCPQTKAASLRALYK